jgi:hypothetical protein
MRCLGDDLPMGKRSMKMLSVCLLVAVAAPDVLAATSADDDQGGCWPATAREAAECKASCDESELDDASCRSDCETWFRRCQCSEQDPSSRLRF